MMKFKECHYCQGYGKRKRPVATLEKSGVVEVLMYCRPCDATGLLIDGEVKQDGDTNRTGHTD